MISVEKRQAIEKRIASKIVKDALAAGYVVSVWDGEEWALKRSGSYKAIMAAMFSVDEETLVFRAADGTKAGSVFLVYGNSGWDVITDYTDNEATRAILAGAEALSEKIDLSMAG
jgi:hypothetical protein